MRGTVSAVTIPDMLVLGAAEAILTVIEGDAARRVSIGADPRAAGVRRE